MTPTDIVRRAYDAVKRRDLDDLLTIFSPDCMFIDATEPETVQGHAAFAEYMNATWDAFPDFHPAEASFCCRDNVVAAELVLAGTHEGPFLGVEPSGAMVRWNAAAFYTIDEERHQIVREAYYYDAATLRAELERAHRRTPVVT